MIGAFLIYEALRRDAMKELLALPVIVIREKVRFIFVFLLYMGTCDTHFRFSRRVSMFCRCFPTYTQLPNTFCFDLVATFCFFPPYLFQINSIPSFPPSPSPPLLFFFHTQAKEVVLQMFEHYHTRAEHKFKSFLIDISTKEDVRT